MLWEVKKMLSPFLLMRCFFLLLSVKMDHHLPPRTVIVESDLFFSSYSSSWKFLCERFSHKNLSHDLRMRWREETAVSCKFSRSICPFVSHGKTFFWKDRTFFEPEAPKTFLTLNTWEKRNSNVKWQCWVGVGGEKNRNRISNVLSLSLFSLLHLFIRDEFL